jgi:hypothetical protein
MWPVVGRRDPHEHNAAANANVGAGRAACEGSVALLQWGQPM